MTEFPHLKRGESERIYKRLPKKERKILDDFKEYCKISAGETKAKDMIRHVLQLRLVVKKDFDKITLKDLRNFLALLNTDIQSGFTKNDIKVHVKKFLRWKFKNWSERFEELSDIRTRKASNEEKINSKTLLKKEEIEKIMKTETRLFWKAFFISLYESGLRPVELKTLRWNQISFNVDGDISEISIFATKTKRARSVYVKEATFYLKRLREESKGELVFPSPKNPNKPITKASVSQWLKKLSKKAINREIFPYICRHSRAHELYLNPNISPKIAQKFMGHNKDMSDVYTHLSSKDVKEVMSKIIYKLEDLPPEKKQELEERIDWLSNYVKHLLGLPLTEDLPPLTESMILMMNDPKAWAKKKGIKRPIEIIMEKKKRER